MTRHLHIVRSEPIDIHELFAENIQKEVGRQSRLSSLRDRAANLRRRLASSSINPGRVVKAFCLAVAVFCIVYFPLRLLVAFL